jgi:hypothetical protein
MSKQDALALVSSFSAAAGTSMWPRILRADLAAGLIKRINDPNSIDQKDMSFCGPACFFRAIASDDPKAYAQTAINLFQTGLGVLRGLVFKPRKEVRDSAPTGGTDPADYILLASLRDSDNIWLSPVGRWEEMAGVTTPDDIEAWFKRAGYSRVHQVTSLTRVTKLPPGLLRQSLNIASVLFDKGWKIVLLIDNDVLYPAKQNNTSLWPNHWVALTSTISNTDEDGLDWPVNFTVYSYGTTYKIPGVPNSLTLDDFLPFYYGYVAAKP